MNGEMRLWKERKLKLFGMNFLTFLVLTAEELHLLKNPV